MGHGGGLFDQGFDGPQADRQSKQLRGAANAFGFLQIPIDLKGDHSAELIAEGLASAGVLGMAGQAWVQDASNVGILFEPAGDLECRAALFAHSKFERFDAAVEKERLEASEHSSGGVLRKVQFAVQFWVFGRQHTC